MSSFNIAINPNYVPNLDDLPAPPPFDKFDVRHIDGDKSNNRASNLEWVRREDMNYRSVWEAPCPVYCVETSTSYPDIYFASSETEANELKIFLCCKGVIDSADGYHFHFDTNIY